MQAKEDHEPVHQYPENSKRHGPAHDVTVLTFHVAGGSSNGDALGGEQLATFRASAVGSCQPIGFITRNTEERALICKAEVAGCRSLQLTKENVGIGGTACNESANASNEWGKEWKGSARQQHQSLGNVVSHARIIHQHGHRHKTTDGDGRLL